MLVRERHVDSFAESPIRFFAQEFLRESLNTCANRPRIARYELRAIWVTRMARRIQDQDLRSIEEVVKRQPDGLTARQIASALDSPLPRRTLQYRLRALVDAGRLVMEGQGRAARYRRAPREQNGRALVREAALPLSRPALEILNHVRRAAEGRKPVGYDRSFLDSYEPGRSFYLTSADRRHLGDVATPNIAPQPAGTYARQILERLLIDLSWNSSRLEGNTYSLLETRRLIDLGEEAEGKQRLEAQMILNHKDAIEFLVEGADEIAFNRYTILNLHALLANNLLGDPAAAGRLRRIRVGIEGSVFHPLEVPQLIEECFDRTLGKAAGIGDPFEQALFVMVHLPYLQPFDDVNKRVSRLAANIPFIKANLTPLSFDGVPRDLYTDAMIGVYELNRTELLRDVFIWACERSAARYAAVRQSLGQPDPLHLKYRAALREVVAAIIRQRMGKRQSTAHIRKWVREHIDSTERAQFQEAVESELLSLHEGNFARYRIRPSEFQAWRAAWK